MLEANNTFNSFKVHARRQYNDFPLTSMEMNIQVGEYIQNICKKPVKLINPALTRYGRKEHAPVLP